MFPVPSMADILMDLYCENVPFHQGHAHQGMAAACNNILAMVDIYTANTIYTIYIYTIYNRPLRPRDLRGGPGPVGGHGQRGQDGAGVEHRGRGEARAGRPQEEGGRDNIPPC